MSSKILIIDDHDETVRVVKFILEQRGYEIIAARTGAAGITKAESDNPDLILLDVMMPGMNGFEVCRRLRADSNFDQVPIIMFTAKDQVDDKWAGFEAGADDYLTKPTDPDELDRRIQVLLKRRTPEDPIIQELETLVVNTKSGPVQAGASQKDRLEGHFFTTDEEQESADVRLPTHMLDAASNLIAVVGVRGGVGTTTIAINLAAALADSGQQVCLVDLDMMQGHIALYLKQKIQQGSLNDLCQLSNSTSITREWQKYAVPEGKGLRLLLARPNLTNQWPVLSPEQVGKLMDVLVQLDHYVVVDAGRGFLPNCLPVLQRAGQVMVCTQPERVAILAARQLLQALPEHMGMGAQLRVLMTAMALESALPQSAVEEFIHHELTATIPISHKEIAYAVNHNAPLVRLRPASKAAEAIREVVTKVVV